MAKNSIADYSATAASNTDIQSVDIDEGCAPSGINNAIRELMADIAGELSPTADAQFAGVNYPAIAGIVESNANFIDTCLVGPAVDGKAWSGKFENGSVWSSLMLATVETSGSDAEVNIWDLTAGALASASPLATVTLTGATPTSIAASMGYVIVGTSDQGFHIVDPHDGSWAERTDGWPRSLTTSTTPALTNNNVNAVAAGLDNQPRFDPRTGGPLPTFAAGNRQLSKTIDVIKPDGTVATPDSAQACDGVAFMAGRVMFTRDDGSDILTISESIHQVTGASFSHTTMFRNSNAGAFAFNKWLGSENGLAVDDSRRMLVGADDDGLSVGFVTDVEGGAGLAPVGLGAEITTDYATGFMGASIRLAALMNSKTLDRSGNSNTLTENGTVTEAAVETGAELMGYSGFSAANFFSKTGQDTDLEVGSSDSMTILGWVKSSEISSDGFLYVYGQSGSSLNRIIVYLNATGDKVTCTFADGSVSVSTNQLIAVADDGEWHLVAFVLDRASGELIGYGDGASVGAGDASSLGAITNASANLTIGAANTSGASPASTATMSLWRVAKTALSPTQVRRIYEAEKGMFAANAKCLLQGASNAVLDARIDPLTGKYIVTQTDSQDIFDGLAIDTERTIAAGGTTFEHGLLWGDGVAEINDANLYASMPATDQRQVNEMVRSMAAELPAGVDLSKAKAWVLVDQSSGAIEASFNVESISSPGTGRTKVTFAVPFKSAEYSSTVTADASQIGSVNNSNMKAGEAELYVVNDAGAGVNSTRVSAAFFGELENE